MKPIAVVVLLLGFMPRMAAGQVFARPFQPTPAVINVKDFMNFPGKSLGCIRTKIVSHAA